MNIKDYAKLINKAKTKKELQDITYKALTTDDECKVFSKKYDKIIQLCIKREIELGI